MNNLKIEIDTLNQIIVYKLFVLDNNTREHSVMGK